MNGKTKLVLLASLAMVSLPLLNCAGGPSADAKFCNSLRRSGKSICLTVRLGPAGSGTTLKACTGECSSCKAVPAAAEVDYALFDEDGDKLSSGAFLNIKDGDQLAVLTTVNSGRPTVEAYGLKEGLTCGGTGESGSSGSSSSSSSGSGSSACSLTCTSSGFRYSCGSGSSSTRYTYCSNGRRSSAIISYSNGHTVTCSLSCSGSGGTCRDDTGQSCRL